MNKNKIFSKRRKIFQQNMKKNSIAIFISPDVKNRNHDVDYRFRQSSDLYYLTGFKEEQSALILTDQKEILFLRERDQEKEIWHGYRLGVKRAKSITGLKSAKPIEQFYKSLEHELKNKSRVYYSTGLNPKNDEKVIRIVHQLFSNSRKGDFGPKSIVEPTSILSEMRLFKDKYEIELLTKSARITARAHKKIISIARPGMYAYELEAEIIRIFRQNNAWEAYPSIVAPGKEACILHYIQNDAKLKKGEMVLVDAGAEYQYMATDVTRTFPVQKKFSPAARDLYSVVLKAQKAAIKACTSGNTLPEIHKLTIRLLTLGLMDLEILGKGLDENLEKQNWKKFYMHRTSHWLGMDVHDAGMYYSRKKNPRKLENGMVITIEPGLYIGKNNKKVPRHFRGMGIRIEDDILIQNGKPVNLTIQIPKSIKDIESLRSS